MKYILGQLDRFGDTIECLAETEKKCEEQIMARYEELYRIRNDGNDPREDMHERWDESYYDNAKSCIEYREYEVGKAQFCGE